MDDKLFHKSTHMVGAVMRELRDTDMTKPTPCTEWNVHELVNHMVNEIAWIAPLLEGKTIAEVGKRLDGDLLQGKPWAAWQEYAAEAGRAVMATAPDAVAHLSYADKPAEAYVNEVAADLIIHGWDLAQALGKTYEIDAATTEAVRQATADIMPIARKGGYVGEALAADESASPQQKLLADYGRSSNWSAAVK